MLLFLSYFCRCHARLFQEIVIKLELKIKHKWAQSVVVFKLRNVVSFYLVRWLHCGPIYSYCVNNCFVVQAINAYWQVLVFNLHNYEIRVPMLSCFIGDYNLVTVGDNYHYCTWRDRRWLVHIMYNWNSYVFINSKVFDSS